MKSGVKTTVDQMSAVMRALADLSGKDVLVGIPESAGNHDGAPISNAAIGYIQETGSPVNNIPPRPFLVPGVAAIQDEVAARLGKAAQGALDGQADTVQRNMAAAGLIAQNSVRRTINDGNGFAPLAERTLSARRRRGRTGEKPLIDTGQLRNSIIYVIRKKA